MPDHKHPRHKFIGFLMAKCPRCGRGPVFKCSAFHPWKFVEMHSTCANCRLNYEPETGFYFGAMYFSYAMIVALILVVGIAFYKLKIFDHAYWVIPLAVVLGLPFIFRYSRLMMLYIVYPAMFKAKFNS